MKFAATIDYGGDQEGAGGEGGPAQKQGAMRTYGEHIACLLRP